jgi:hypothetical protein
MRSRQEAWTPEKTSTPARQPETLQMKTHGLFPYNLAPIRPRGPRGLLLLSECPRAHWYKAAGRALRDQGWRLRAKGPSWNEHNALIEWEFAATPNPKRKAK